MVISSINANIHKLFHSTKFIYNKIEKKQQNFQASFTIM